MLKRWRWPGIALLAAVTACSDQGVIGGKELEAIMDASEMNSAVSYWLVKQSRDYYTVEERWPARIPKRWRVMRTEVALRCEPGEEIPCPIKQWNVELLTQR